MSCNADRLSQLNGKGSLLICLPMRNWFFYLKNGLARKRTEDRFAASAASSRRTAKELFRGFVPFFKKSRRRFALGLGLVFLTAAASIPLPFLGRFLIDDVIMKRQLPLLAWTILAMIVLAVASRLLDLYQQYYFERFHQEVVLDIQAGLLDRVFHFGKPFFDESRTGYLMKRLEGDVHGTGWFFSGSMAVMVESFFRFLGGAIFLLYLDWRLAMIVGVILPGIALMVRYFSGKLRTLSNETMESQADVTGHFQESLANMTLIKAFTAEGKTLGQLVGTLKKALNIAIEQATVHAAAGMVITSLPGIARAVVLLIGAYWVIVGHWSLGSLFAFQAYLFYVFGPVQSLTAANLEMQGALASANRIANLFDLVPEENTGRGVSVARLNGEIEFKAVSFAYDADVPILEDVHFSIRGGERIALVGTSGVGKTTLISLILRFYKPTGGEIFFDSRPASDFEVASLRKRIGYVPQQNWLLSGTILENILYGDPAAGLDDAVTAAKAAGIHEFITTLPGGYQTTVGERGISLSEGQRQRICIARAILKDTDIVLIDEPFSALDGHTGDTLASALLPVFHGKTVIVVTNHPRLLVQVDRIFLLREKPVEAVGTHAELLVRSPFYRGLLGGDVK